MKYLALLCCLATTTTLAKMPSFDIYVADLFTKNGLLNVGEVENVTQAQGYDNQPMFLPDGDSLMYTSALSAEGLEQTDSILLHLKTGHSVNLTQTHVSEYSPTLMPDANNFSVIRVEQGKQKLWRYPLNSGGPSSHKASVLLADVDPVGYHAWVDDDRVLLFVLGEPHTLQLASLSTQKSQILDKNIGPSLYNIPDSHTLSYTVGMGEGDDISWQLKSFDPVSAELKVLTTLPKGAYYYGWSGDGKAIAAVDGVLLQWDRIQAADEWQVFADMTNVCPKGITRLTTNTQVSKLAFVCTL